MSFAGLRVGYVPYSPSLAAPGDRRRIVGWAASRGADLEVHRPGSAYDVVVLSARADVTRWSRAPASGPPLVFDLIDDYLAPSSGSIVDRLRGPAKFAARQLDRPVLDYRAALVAMCRRAEAVVCSSPEQREHVAAYARNVHVILDVHDELITACKTTYELGDTVNLVWEGLPYTLDDFECVAPALRRLAARHSMALHLVTDLEYGRFGGRYVRRRTADVARRILPATYLYEWNRHLLAQIVTACDIALIPLDMADSLARGKPENKLLIFWRMGMPVLTSATPSYKRAMAGAGLDLTCETLADWEERIEHLIIDGAARADAGRRGRVHAEAHYGSDEVLVAWDTAIASVLR